MTSFELYQWIGSFVCLYILYHIIRFFFHNIELDDITNRAVLVTGCDMGFGNILATLLDECGVRVFAGCLTEDGARTLDAKTSSRTKTFQIDITNRDSVARALLFVNNQIGDEGLWGLVNNAGVMPTFAPIEWTTMDEFEFTCNVNLLGTINVTKTFLPLVRKAKGRIVNVCSAASESGYPGLSTYVVSKSALKSFSVCLRRELYNTGVTVVTIEPGGFRTRITDEGRLKKICTDAYKRADPESQNVYSGNIANYLFYSISGVTKYTCNDPRRVPDRIIKALFTKYPQQRYLVGQDAYLFFQLRQKNSYRNLAQLTIGIMGLGGIGDYMAKQCKALGMTVWGLTRHRRSQEQKESYVDEYRTQEDLIEFLENCDYICSVLPNTDETVGMLSGDVFKHCSKKKGVFINCGRGDVTDEQSIIKAIQNEWIGGAILDCAVEEPLYKDSPLWTTPRVTITPHISGWSHSTHRANVIRHFVDNYQKYIENQPLFNVFDWDRGY